MRISIELNRKTDYNPAVALDRNYKFKLLCCALFVGLFTVSASAANVTLKGNDAFGTESFIAGSTNWSNNAVPSSTNDYFTGPYTLRTPANTNLAYTFAGRSLTLQPATSSGGNGSMNEKSTAVADSTRVLTINNFTNAGGWIRAAANSALSTFSVTITGNVFAVTAPSTIEATAAHWIIDSPIVGTGDIMNSNTVVAGVPYSNTYGGDNSGWTGRLLINNVMQVIFNNVNAPPANPASLTPDQITFNAAGTLVDNVGVSLANANGGITLNAAGAISNAAGATTIISEPITGAFSFSYAGDGILTLSGANTFAGGLTLNGGQLNIKNANALGTGIFTLNGTNAIIDNTSGSAMSNPNNNPITIGHSFTYAGSANDLNLGTGAVTLLVTPNLNVNAHTLTIGGAVSGAGYGINKQGAGTLVLGGANTFTGTLTVGAGTVTLGSGAALASTNIDVVSGATLDASLPGLTLASGAVLFGSGTVKGNVSTVSSSTFIQPGSNSVGTLTFNNNLDMSAGGSATFDVSTTAGSGNDQIVVGGNLALSSVGTIHLNALSGGANLDTRADYVLFQVAGTTTMTTTPSLAWDGTPPGNYLHYSIQKVGNNVVLHYSAVIAPAVTATVNNSTVPRNGSFTVTATVTPGSGSIVSVTVDLSAVGGSSAANLVSAGGNVWTNTFTVSGSTTLGAKSLTVTATDNSSPPLTGGYVISPFNVVAVAQVWNGLGPDNIWSTGANWVSTVPPLDGDSVTFAGTTRLTPRMDQNYSLAWLEFDSSAGRFVIGSDNSSTLTLTGGVTNNSTTPETINVPVTLSGDQTYEVAASGVLTNLAGVNGDASLAKTGDGTLILAGSNGFTGSLFARSGTIIMSSGSINNGNNYSDVGRSNVDTATLTLTGTATFTNNADFNVGDLDFSTGTLNLEGNSVMSVANFFIGSANAAGSVASGTVNINGGTLIQRNTAFGTFVLGGRSSDNTFNGTGVLNLTNGYVYSACGLRVGNYGTGTVNQYGGLLVATNDQTGITLLRQSQGVAGYYYLNGGILRTEKISSQQTTGTREFHFNGGMLQAGNGNLGATPFINSLSDAYVGAGGATIDSQGYAIIIDQPLEHDPAVSGADGGLTKLGTGVMYLDDTNTYTGNTVVSNGLLAGIGIIGSPVVVKAGGNIGGGVATNEGTLTVNNNLTIQGGAFLRISKTGGVLANDSIACNTVNYGGTLTISNATADATPLAVGDTFTLFNATTQNANFANIVNANGNGTTYSFANGVLTVLSVGPDLTKNQLTNNITGGGTSLSLSWSPGWKLQVQTNSLSKGLSTNWITVTDGIKTSTNAPIGSSDGCVFYRLTSQ
jgi:fibronectin-binding autotransporter adhesin